MVIGSFGAVVFQVSERTARTFDEFSHQVSARLAVHETIATPPRTEFLGPGQGEISFRLQLHEQLGVDPRSEAERLQQMTEQGLHAPLILGGRPVGNGEWMIEECSADFLQVGGRGKVEYAEVSLTIKEYF